MQSSPPDKPVSPKPAGVTQTPSPLSIRWSWPERNQKQWEKVTGEYEEYEEYASFYRYWSNPASRSNFGDKFPYELSLGLGPTISPAGKPILVTEAYDKMFRRILDLRKDYLEGGMVKGMVITGQPGIGKTTFQKFVLAQLISAQEVVLLCDSHRILLFYQGEVYFRLTTTGFSFLPTPSFEAGVYYPILTLIDVTDLQEPPITESTNIWPIQTSSPNPIRWKTWSKHYEAALLGMPLWNIEELQRGLSLQHAYDAFQKRLDAQLRPSPTSNPISNKPIAAAMEVLRIEAVRLAELKAAADWDKGVMPMVADGEARPLLQFHTTSDAFVVLVRNATEEFGFAPRDVYNGVFNLPKVKETHTTKVKDLQYPQLASLSDTTRGNHFSLSKDR